MLHSSSLKKTALSARTSTTLQLILSDSARATLMRSLSAHLDLDILFAKDGDDNLVDIVDYEAYAANVVRERGQSR